MAETFIPGGKLHYREAGSGPPLLLIHGTGGHGDLFEPIAPQLAARYRVISYDRRGFSRSEGRPHAGKDYFSRHAADAAALLRAVGAAPASVLGWSGGGVVALTLAVEHPDVVKRLVLYEPSLHVRKHMTMDVAPKFIKTLLLGLAGRKRSAAATFFGLALVQPDGKSAFDTLDSATRESVLANAEGVLAELKAGTGEELTGERLARIRVPVANIVGSATAPFLAAASDRLAALLPAMRVVRVPGGNHIMMVDRPTEFARLVEEQLSQGAGEPG